MPAYRYLAIDVRTGEPLAELPLEQATYTWALNAPGQFRATLGIRQPPRVERVLAPVLAPGTLGTLAVAVERDRVPVWAGWVWTLDADLDAGTLELAGEGWHSYFRRRVLRATKTYAQVEQVEIATDLLDWAQAQPGGSVLVTTSDATPTGILRDRVYEAFERHVIGERIEELAGVIDGFTFRYEPRWTASGTLQVRFLTGPAAGRQTDLVFEVGRPGVSELRVQVDGTALATAVDAVGAGEGDSRLLATVYNTPQLGQVPLLDAVVSYTDVTVPATLEAHARTRLARGQAPVLLPALTVDPSLDPPLGSYVPGDIVRVRGGYGLVTVDTLARIVEVEVRVDAEGAEEATLTFAGVDAFTAP